MPSSMGDPLAECFQPISANLSVALLGKTRQTSSWSSPRRFTQNFPTSRTLGQLDEWCPAQKRTWGGSSESDANEPTAKPTGPSSVVPVITVTPVGKWPSTWRYLAESKDDASLLMSVTDGLLGPGFGRTDLSER